MTVGILTFHNTLNYGAELQAYALSSAIRTQGHCTQLINYQCAAVGKRESVKYPSIKHVLRHPVNSFREVHDLPERQARAEKFSEFAGDRLKMDIPLESQAAISRRYETVVVGSDQVWNLACTGGDLTYFLGDIPHGVTRKVAYAASFGSVSVPLGRVDEIGDALRDFEAISVREAAGVDIVREISGREATQVLDPTLLLTREEWLGMCGPSCREEGYVLAYVVSERRNTLRFAHEVSERMGLPLVVIDCYGAPRLSEREAYANGASPEEFLTLIRDAALVVTSSFHGFALSLALGSEVRYSLDTKKLNANSRLENLAKLVGVKDHEVSEGRSCRPIDFDAVWKRIGEQREKSLGFLAEALG